MDGARGRPGTLCGVGAVGSLAGLAAAVALAGCARGASCAPCAPPRTPVVARAIPAAPAPPPIPPVLEPADPLERLVAGNRRYAAARIAAPRRTPARRAELTETQHPFAVVLGCSDSRVAPEVLFDQGLGDLFVVRVAGNVVDDVVLASVEYAAEHLHAPLVVVLGHERCGAVEAAVKGGEAHGHLPALVAEIAPAVEAVKGREGDPLDLVVRENVRRVVRGIEERSPLLAGLVREGKLRIVGARYDLDTGEVEILR
jgi:carbonic anhydrase